MPDLFDMQLFVRAIACGSLSAAGRELGFSPAVASKRLTRLEDSLGVRLIQRSSRRLTLTEEGTIYLERASAILAEVSEAEAAVTGGAAEARGILRISAPTALGRRWVAPLLADFCMRYPAVSGRLSLSERVEDLLDGGFDLAIRIGAQDDSRLISRRLASNRRIICATPAYLAQHGTPTSLAELVRHNCLVLQRPGMSALGWTFQTVKGLQTLRVSDTLSSDNGEQIHDWVRGGHGLALKSLWDVADDIASGALVSVLDEHIGPDADLFATYPSRNFLPMRTRLFIDALVAKFKQAESAMPR
ncbi:LysR family transcriptional regulator [Uliginosibacterium gangwonense]|uniref:LysR family transcriptional regulator n=1 Tax=Uliginosibacterium gangwonense TaxID=392736 RepID=UPI0003735291|nr:LysR family transcriptional regulator [Uliginosibacterium gangwonense]